MDFPTFPHKSELSPYASTVLLTIRNEPIATPGLSLFVCRNLFQLPRAVPVPEAQFAFIFTNNVRHMSGEIPVVFKFGLSGKPPQWETTKHQWVCFLLILCLHSLECTQDGAQRRATPWCRNEMPILIGVVHKQCHVAIFCHGVLVSRELSLCSE